MPVSRAGLVEANSEFYRCTFSNLSRSGAVITFDGPVDLPDQFVVHLNRRITRACTVQWQQDNETGVSFD